MSLLFYNRFVPKQYSVSLALNDTKPNYSGNVSIELVKNDKFHGDGDTPDYFSVSLNTVEVVSVSAVLRCGDKAWKLLPTLNKTAESTEYSCKELPLRQLADTACLTLEIRFIAVVRKIMTYSDVTKGVFSTKYTDPSTGKSDLFLLSTHSQPHFARCIFPCLDDVNCKCPIQLELTADNRFSCISNMPVESSEYLSETSNKLVRFAQSPPMSTSVFSFAVGNFDFLEQTVRMPVSKCDFPIRVYTMVGESQRAQYALSTVAAAVGVLEQKFNVKYPMPKLDIVALPFLSDGGVENWSMIQVINDHILLPDWKVTDAHLAKIHRTIRDVLVHEIVHMYVGNYVSFDSYDHTWMNESFATFMSNTIINSVFDNTTWFNFLNSDLQQLKVRNMSADSAPIFTANVATSRIHDTFSRNSYEKGIFVMRSLASLFVENDDQLNQQNYDVFFGMVGDFIKKNEFGNFKPVDLWNFLKAHKSNRFGYDIPTIMNSWIRTSGFPILTVTKQDDGSYKIEQHHCLDEADADIEDVPFQIPLLIKKSDGTLGRQLMTDRSLVISAEDLSDDFFFLNANDSFIATVIYPEATTKEIASKFHVLNNVEQMQYFKNFSSVIGTHYQSNESITSFFTAIKSIKKVSRPDHAAMTFALSVLSNIYKSINTLACFNDAAFYKKLDTFINDLSNKYVAQLDWDDVDWKVLGTEELRLRNAILSLKYDNPATQVVGKKLFKKVLHGPKESVPAELLTTVFAIAAQSSNLKEYKEISKLVRNPGLVVNNVFPSVPNDVQTAAINSLGCMRDPELRYKTLNFVATNPDVKMIELALLGFRFQMSAYGELWKWYLQHYTVWYSKYARDNKSYQGLFFKHVSELALECAYYSPQLSKEVENFVASKNDDVKTWFEEAKAKLDSIRLLSEANQDLKLML